MPLGVFPSLAPVIGLVIWAQHVPVTTLMQASKVNFVVGTSEVPLCHSDNRYFIYESWLLFWNPSNDDATLTPSIRVFVQKKGSPLECLTKSKQNGEADGAIEIGTTMSTVSKAANE